MAVQVTEAEWKIMECLWDHAPQTMGEITATLEPATGWTRQTVITLLKRMYGIEGKPHDFDQRITQLD